jgi:uncharacterized protein
MRRIQKEKILQDLQKKMVFLVGPRQVGKTYLSKEIMKNYKKPLYLNYDFLEDRKIIKEGKWEDSVDLIVFDELHKMPKWKNYLKGHFDVKRPNLHFLVTGSARLETYRQAGDSLAGRFFIHHLMPFSLKELENTEYENNIERLLERGGLPEPFLTETVESSNVWRNNYSDSLIREDVVDFGNIEKFKQMKDIFNILKTKVGSNISYQNISQDLNLSTNTVKKYVEILEALYVVFLIRPFSKKVSRAILKEPKVYFYDIGLLQVGDGKKFENLIAISLLKHLLGRKDFEGYTGDLFYIKNKEKKEVDFAITNNNGELDRIIEVKLSDEKISPNLKYFTEKLQVNGVQVVKNIRNSFKENDLISVKNAKEFLKELFL